MGEKVKVEVKIDNEGHTNYLFDGNYYGFVSSNHNQSQAKKVVKGVFHAFPTEMASTLGLAEIPVVATYEVEL